MAITNQEAHANRMKSNKRFDAYIPNYLAKPFTEKLQKDGLKYSDWLKNNIEKYLKKN